MLVMSRRQDQKIVFPGLGITVTLLQVKGNTARLGIDAPREIRVLRDEISDPPPETASKPDPHGLRNVLNSINLYVMLYQKQMEVGMVEEAAGTFMKMVEHLERLTYQGKVDFQMEASPRDQIDGRVMIVEDDAAQCDLLGRLLSMQGLNVSSHHDGRSALQSLREGFTPEILLLDWTMPEFGGQWLVPKLRHEFGATCPKVFVVSGSDSIRNEHREGVDAWIAKPLNHEALLARIRAVYSTGTC